MFQNNCWYISCQKSRFSLFWETRLKITFKVHDREFRHFRDILRLFENFKYQKIHQFDKILYGKDEVVRGKDEVLSTRDEYFMDNTSISWIR